MQLYLERAALLLFFNRWHGLALFIILGSDPTSRGGPQAETAIECALCNIFLEIFSLLDCFFNHKQCAVVYFITILGNTLQLLHTGNTKIQRPRSDITSSKVKLVRDSPLSINVIVLTVLIIATI